jgi:uncharacterized Zn finger protein (UPF0148 family)
MTGQKSNFHKDEPRREEEGNGRVACPICGALVYLSDVTEVSRHLNGLHSRPSDKAARF